MRDRSLGQEDPLVKGVATHSSILAWRIPWRQESGGLWDPHSWTRLKQLSMHAWEKKGRQVYIYRVCCINLLICYFWVSQFPLMTLSYHLVSFSYSNMALFLQSSSVLLLSNTLHFYMLLVQQYNYIHIVLCNCFLNQLRKKKHAIKYLIIINRIAFISTLFFCV